MVMDEKKVGTKQKIVHVAMDLFAKKGYTETSIREIAFTVGIKESSIYNHFESKGAILDHLLDYYRNAAINFRAPEETLSRLTQEATTEDILACLMLSYPPDEEEYYLKALTVLFQEQFRNDTVREYIAKDIVQWQEQHVSNILQRLIDSGALDENTDVDFWAKLHVSTTYMFYSRYIMGIGEMHPNFKGKGYKAMLKSLYDTIFRLNGTKTNH